MPELIPFPSPNVQDYFEDGPWYWPLPLELYRLEENWEECDRRSLANYYHQCEFKGDLQKEHRRWEIKAQAIVTDNTHKNTDIYQYYLDNGGTPLDMSDPKTIQILRKYGVKL